MLRFLFTICCVTLISVLLISCGDDDGEVAADEKNEIEKVLYESWKEGYEQEDIAKYLSAFSEGDFLHMSDNGTEFDTSDDVILKSIDQEREATQQVFARFKNIMMELTDIEVVSSTTNDSNEAKVQCKYKIQFVMETVENNCNYIGYYAEGENTFTFRKLESIGWRISIWEDKAYSPQTIKTIYAEQEG